MLSSAACSDSCKEKDTTSVGRLFCCITMNQSELPCLDVSGRISYVRETGEGGARSNLTEETVAEMRVEIQLVKRKYLAQHLPLCHHPRLRRHLMLTSSSSIVARISSIERYHQQSMPTTNGERIPSARLATSLADGEASQA